MKKTLELPTVTRCEVMTCAYNRDKMCHALAITVGDEDHARCDTFVQASDHTNEKATAGVGACKATGCKHNRDYECQAGKIEVEPCGDHGDCTTFEMR